jgi:hypothetical protein
LLPEDGSHANLKLDKSGKFYKIFKIAEKSGVNFRLFPKAIFD